VAPPPDDAITAETTSLTLEGLAAAETKPGGELWRLAALSFEITPFPADEHSGLGIVKRSWRRQGM